MGLLGKDNFNVKSVRYFDLNAIVIIALKMPRKCVCASACVHE